MPAIVIVAFVCLHCSFVRYERSDSGWHILIFISFRQDGGYSGGIGANIACDRVDMIFQAVDFVCIFRSIVDLNFWNVIVKRRNVISVFLKSQ